MTDIMNMVAPKPLTGYRSSACSTEPIRARLRKTLIWNDFKAGSVVVRPDEAPAVVYNRGRDSWYRFVQANQGVHPFGIGRFVPWVCAIMIYEFFGNFLRFTLIWVVNRKFS